MPKELLELVMIVKNSGEDIIQMLNSAKKYIDHWTILDTGSTDNTMDNIRNTLKDVPGNLYDATKLYDEPFVDFSTARNRALELAGTKCVFSIMLDDTYNITDGKSLRKFLKKKKKKKNSNTFFIIIEDNEKLYPSTRIFRTASKIRYKHKIHEIPEIINKSDNPADTAPGTIKDIISNYMTSRTSSRRESDIKLMKEELQLNPDNRRMKIHLIRSLIKSKDRDKARELLNEIIIENKNDAFDYESRLLFVMSEPNILKSINKVKELAEKYPKESEPAYFMALLKYQQGNMKDAYIWITRAANTTSELTIIHKYIKKFEIPYIFADICIKLKKYKAAEKVIKTYLPRYNDTRLLNMVYAISNIPQKGTELETPIIVFHATDTVKCWSPNDFKGKGKGHGSGSEIMLAEMAKQFAKMGFRVFVFGKFKSEQYDTQGMYNGVQYMDSSFYQQFINTYIIHILIVSRNTSNMIYHNNVKKVFLWIHDVLPVNSQCKRLLNIQYDSKRFKKILCLCNWHKNYVSNAINAEKTKIFVTRNAIKTSRFSRQHKKIPFRFIYASSIDRGVEHLLRMIPKIHKIFPETTLHLFLNIKGCNTRGNTAELVNIINKLPYVTLRDRVSQEEIAYEYSISDVWLYPTDFKETYCITALEAQAAGCLCACTDIGSLSEIVGERGIVGGKDISDINVEENLIKELVKVLKNPEEKEILTKKAREWALKQSFQNLAKDWKEKLFCL
jgi:glycosyltransferase involved in cell wall biosynthesis